MRDGERGGLELIVPNPNKTVKRFLNRKWAIVREEVESTDREAKDLAAEWKRERPGNRVRVIRFKRGARPCALNGWRQDYGYRVVEYDTGKEER